MYHINQMKKISGVSVRTLRYYDQLGLLRPVSKTEGGHRQYTHVELKKLQQIQFLKTIGFTLKDIQSMLESDDWDWPSSLKEQLAFVINEQKRLSKIEQSVHELLNGIAIEGEEFQIQKIMQLYSRDAKESISSKKAELHMEHPTAMAKVPTMSSTDPNSLEWIALLGQLKKQIHLGHMHTRIQNIIRRMDEKKSENFAGEDHFLDKLWEIRMSPDQSQEYRLYPIDQEVLEFMERAYEYYLEEKKLSSVKADR